jgi:hypothetical protein
MQRYQGCKQPRVKENKEPIAVMKHSQQQQHSNHNKDNTETTNRFSKGNSSKKKTMHTHCHCPIEDLGFSPRRKSEYTQSNALNKATTMHN